MKVAVVGAGFVGLTTSCMLATKGHEVELFDIDDIKIDSINKGIVPFYEQELEANLNLNINAKKLIAKKINSISAENYGAVLICVGTPSKQDGSIDLSYVESALILTCSSVSEKIPIVIRSTVLPGTTRALQEKILRLGFNHNLAMVPEFLREGTALHDSLTPDRIIIGSSNTLAIEVLENLFAAGSVKKIITSTYSAEFIKYLTKMKIQFEKQDAEKILYDSFCNGALSELYFCGIEVYWENNPNAMNYTNAKNRLKEKQKEN